MAAAIRSLQYAVALLREARWINRRSLLVCGAFCAAFVLYGIVRFDLFFTTNGLMAPTGQPLAFDFLNYYAAAKAAAAGHAGLVYDHDRFQAFEHGIVGPRAFAWGIYSYPPFALLLTLPLASLPYMPALIVWRVLGVVLVWAALRRLVGWPAAALAAVGAPAAFYNLNFGQNGYFTAALLGGGLIAVERRPILAGICFGCLAYKPHLGLLLPVALAVGGYWRAIAAAAATIAVLSLLSLAAFGMPAWLGFFHNMAVNRGLIDTATDLTRFPSVFAAARELGAGLKLAYAAQIASAVLALAAIVALWRRPGPVEIKAAALTVAIFLTTPYAWDYDALVLLFAAAWLARMGMRTGFLAWERLTVLALVILPALMFLLIRLWGVPIGPAVLWLAFAVLLRRGLGIGVSFNAASTVRDMPIAASAWPLAEGAERR